MKVGDSFNRGKVTFIQGESADELQTLLNNIRVPYRILSIYGVGSRHYAWIVTEMPLPKAPKAKQTPDLSEITDKLNKK